MNFALLVLRLVVGILLAAHGSQKLFGAFGGGGIQGTGEMFHKMGFHPPKTMALAAGLGEFIGGALMAIGLFSPLAAVAVISVMMNASSAHWGRGPFNSNGGWELPLTYATVGAVIGFTGAGAFSLDKAIGWTYGGNGWGTAALIIGLALGGANLALRQARLQEEGQNRPSRRNRKNGPQTA